MNKIIHVVGNRPQFIKLAVMYNELAKDNNIQQTIIHSGQHYSDDMSGLFFRDLNIPSPDVNFNLEGFSRNKFIGEAADKFENYFEHRKDDAVLVYGDTNTTLAAAMAAKKKGLRLLHFEAGVRTYDNKMPEEINRILTDRLSDVNYCCTQKNYQTMQQEGYGNKIANDLQLSGDLMLDAFLKIEPSTKLTVPHKKYVACTIHREANLSCSHILQNIIHAINKIHASIPVVMPMHPHTKKKIEEYGIICGFDILPPLGYPEMKTLLSNAYAIITDSGGMSREAYFLRKKSVIIMDDVFWPEILESNCSLQSGADTEMIFKKFNELPALNADFTTAIFGTGNAAENIHQHLNEYLR